MSHPPFELFPLFSTRDSSAPGPTRLSYCLCPVLQPHLPVQALSSVTGTLTQPHLATLFHLLQGLGGSFTPGADPAPSLLRALPGALSPQDRVPDPQPGLKRPHMVRSCWPPSLSPHQPLPSHLSPTTAIVLLPPAFPPAVPQTRRVTGHQLSLWALPLLNNSTFVLSLGSWWSGQWEGVEERKFVYYFSVCSVCLTLSGQGSYRTHLLVSSMALAQMC